MAYCLLSRCAEPAQYRVVFDTGDEYLYCNTHGWRWRDHARVASIRYVDSGRDAARYLTVAANDRPR